MNVLFPPKTCFIANVKLKDSSDRKAFKVGSAIILGFSAFIVILWACGYLPGSVGRTFSLITGFLWTPTIMEPTLFLMGLFSILILNHHRRTKSGPECVPLEIESEVTPGAGPTEPPQPPSGDEMVATIEGTAALGNHKDTLRLIRGLPEDLLESEEILAVRLQFARDNNDPNNIRGLSRKLRELNPDHPLLQTP